MNPIRKLKIVREEGGQVLALLACVLTLLILFVGFGIDFGFAYLTKADLSKGADAAALAAMRNLGQGMAQAQAMAQSEFNLNFNPISSLAAGPPTVNVGFSTDNFGNPTVTVNASVLINTFFIRLWPAYKTLNVASLAQATRPPIILSLVLDSSGSMNYNGGAQALGPAVQDFLGYFLENADQLSESSFASVANVDVPMTKLFKTPITNAVNRFTFGGATFAQGGLQDGQAQVNAVTNPGPNAIKVVVFFTDGWANTNEDTLACPPATLLNYGGCSPVEQQVGWCSGVSFLNPRSGSQTSCGAGYFPSQLAGKSVPLTQTNICDDAIFRTENVSNTMRLQNMTVYSIGLGDKINQTYLLEVANDPSSPTYNPNEPVGEAAFAPTAGDLESVFQTIASKIILRLTQ